MDLKEEVSQTFTLAATNEMKPISVGKKQGDKRSWIDLVFSDPRKHVRDVMSINVVSVELGTDREHCARLMETHLWEMKLTFAKMTHNRLGFGKKLIWEI